MGRRAGAVDRAGRRRGNAGLVDRGRLHHRPCPSARDQHRPPHRGWVDHSGGRAPARTGCAPAARRQGVLLARHPQPPPTASVSPPSSPSQPTRPHTASVEAHAADGHQPFDSIDYRQRNVIERRFCHLKQWRGLATRFDKLAIVYRAAAVLHAAISWTRRLSDTLYGGSGSRNRIGSIKDQPELRGSRAEISGCDLPVSDLWARWWSRPSSRLADPLT